MHREEWNEKVFRHVAFAFKKLLKVPIASMSILIQPNVKSFDVRLLLDNYYLAKTSMSSKGSLTKTGRRFCR